MTIRVTVTETRTVDVDLTDPDYILRNCPAKLKGPEHLAEYIVRRAGRTLKTVVPGIGSPELHRSRFKMTPRNITYQVSSRKLPYIEKSADKIPPRMAVPATG